VCTRLAAAAALSEIACRRPHVFDPV
jgi:hypothetical protein